MRRLERIVAQPDARRADQPQRVAFREPVGACMDMRDDVVPQLGAEEGEEWSEARERWVVAEEGAWKGC